MWADIEDRPSELSHDLHLSLNKRNLPDEHGMIDGMGCGARKNGSLTEGGDLVEHRGLEVVELADLRKILREGKGRESEAGIAPQRT